MSNHPDERKGLAAIWSLTFRALANIAQTVWIFIFLAIVVGAVGWALYATLITIGMGLGKLAHPAVGPWIGGALGGALGLLGILAIITWLIGDANAGDPTLAKIDMKEWAKKVDAFQRRADRARALKSNRIEKR